MALNRVRGYLPANGEEADEENRKDVADEEAVMNASINHSYQSPWGAWKIA